MGLISGACGRLEGRPLQKSRLHQRVTKERLTRRIYQCGAGALLVYLIGFHRPDPWMAELMMSSALLQFRTRKDLPATALLSLPLFVVFCLLHWTVLFAIPMALGSASLFALTIRNSEMLRDAVTMPAGYILVEYAHPMIIRMTPRTIDLSLSAIDSALKLSASAFVAWGNLHPLVRLCLLLVYNWLPLVAAIIMVYTAQRKHYLLSLFSASVLAAPCYLLFPAVGPAHLSDMLAPRNCMPSLHFTWAFLAFWYSPPAWQWLMAGFVLLTGVATVTVGEHYFIDLVAAVPFAYVAIEVAHRCLQSRRTLPIRDLPQTV
jgi:PAP2 superfamily